MNHQTPLMVAASIPGYTFGTATVERSPVSLDELEKLKISVGFTSDDHHYLQLAGEVLSGQTKQIVGHWRSTIIASIPHLARHSRTADGNPIPQYLASSNLRFEQWILDTCVRPYDQDWLNYQHEIALRHTSAKKNRTDTVQSTPYIPLRDVIAFTATMNETIKPYLAAKHHPVAEVDRMHAAWCKSIQLQIALWGAAYLSPDRTGNEW